MKSNKRRWLFRGCCALFLLPFGLFVLLSIFQQETPAPPLFSRATLVPGTQAISLQMNCQWASDGQLLHIEQNPSSGTVSVVLLDPKTGRTTSNIAFPTHNDQVFYDYDNAMVSPDGKYTLVSGLKNLFVIAVKGKESIAIPTNSPAYARAAWTPDSRHIAAAIVDKTNSMHLMLYGLDGNVERDIPLGAANEYAGTLMGVNAHNRAIIHVGGMANGNVRSERFALVDLNASKDPIHVSVVDYGNAGLGGYVFCQRRLSQDGEHVLWIMRRGFSMGILFRYLLHRKKPPNDWFLVTSKLDGSDVHIVGKETLPLSELLDAPRWLPDGKRVSFIRMSRFANAPLQLYVVPLKMPDRERHGPQ